MLTRRFIPHQPRRQWTAIPGRRRCIVCGRRWPCTIERLRRNGINARLVKAA